MHLDGKSSTCLLAFMYRFVLLHRVGLWPAVLAYQEEGRPWRRRCVERHQAVHEVPLR